MHCIEEGVGMISGVVKTAPHPPPSSSREEVGSIKDARVSIVGKCVAALCHFPNVMWYLYAKLVARLDAIMHMFTFENRIVFLIQI